MRLTHPLTLLTLSLLLVACATTTPTAIAPGTTVEVEGGAYINLTPRELQPLLAAHDFFFVNTHIPYEGELTDTDAFIPYDQTEALMSQFPAEKDAKIILYCRSGRMSAITASVLVKAGYTNVWNLDGGMVAWQQAGYEVLHK